MFQFPGQGKPAQGVLYDSDFGRAIDSVLALALLHGLENKKDCRIAALSIGNPSLQAAQLCDVIEKFYASATTGLAAQFFQGTPIGLGGAGAPVTSAAVTATLGKKDDAGKYVYTPRVKSVNDTAEPCVLMRNILQAQYDNTAVVVLAGSATNLTALLALNGGRELVAQKIKVLAVSESGLKGDIPAAKKLFAEWPGSIVLVDRDAARQVLFPAASVEKDFAYAPNHPVADAYRGFQPMPYDAETGAMAAVLWAVRPKEAYFAKSEPGTITIGVDGSAQWRAGGGGKHARLVPDAAQSEKILKAYTELASAKPMPRAFRRPPQDEAEKKDLPEGVPPKSK